MDYVLGILRAEEHVFAEAPDEVVLATLDLLCKRGVLNSVNGHIDVEADPGASLRFPSEAAKAIYQAVESFALYNEAGTGLFIDRVFHFLGPSGSGGTGSISRNPPDRKAVESLRAAKALDALKRFEWDKASLLLRFGDDGQEEGEVIINHVGALLRAEAELVENVREGVAPESPPSDSLAGSSVAGGMPVLAPMSPDEADSGCLSIPFHPSQTDNEILDFMDKQQGARVKTGDLAAAIDRDAKSLAKNLSDLVKVKLLDTKGRSGYGRTQLARPKSSL